MVQVNGGYTLNVDGILDVVQSLKAQLLIPMRFFSAFTLEQFLSRAREKFDVEFSDTPSVVVSKATLPSKPKFLVLPGR